jgi:hypothetical protein
LLSPCGYLLAIDFFTANLAQSAATSAKTCVILTAQYSVVLILKNTIIDKTLTYASETSTLTKRDRKQLNIFQRQVYRRILGPVYDNQKENWRILTNKEIYAIVKKSHYNRDNKIT